MEKGEFPAHFLYGATGLPANGIEVVWHRSRLGLPRWRMMLRNAWLILTSREHFDAVYATHYRGLELIVLLRALRLFRARGGRGVRPRRGPDVWCSDTGEQTSGSTTV